MLKVREASQGFDKSFLRHVLRIRDPTAESTKQRRRKANGHVLKAQDQCVKRVRIPILRMDH